MREKVKDKGRLEHILNAINVLLTNKGRYTFEDVKTDPKFTCALGMFLSGAIV